MIADFVRLSALYLIVYLYVRHTSGKEMASLVKWLGVVSLALMVLSGIQAPFKQFFSDLHGVSQTYIAGKNTVSSILGGSGSAPAPAGGSIPEVGYRGLLERGSRFGMPLKGEVTQGFKGADHHGIDFAGNVGAAIKASRTGKVTSVGDMGVYGLTVMLDNGNGYETLYGHCSKTVVRVGNVVFAGDKIAEVGSSGNSTGPHLHFEIRINGKAVDPASFLK